MRQSFPAEREVEAAGTVEGAKKVVYTTTYERDPKVRRAFLKGKHLKCEVCGFDFEKAYGKLGAGYIEVHHKRPVSEGVRMTDLDNDLAMLCSNCHRMIHRGRDHMITLEELKGIIDSMAASETN
ncbi:MAG: HNH endonuclease [Synergistaceae bacterium]|nr:HNH endonuclease [Synergistaceae bacterium]